MAKGTPKDPSAALGVPPVRFAETPPPVYPSGDYSYTLEVCMQMQKTLGQVEEAVKQLRQDFNEDRKRLNRISHVIYAAGVVGSIALTILLFLANKVADLLIAGIKPH